MLSYCDDQEAFDDVSKGSVDGYRYLFDQYFTDLCKFLGIYLHDASLVEEVALDVFACIWENRERIKIKTSFAKLLFGIARNRAISKFRMEQKNILSCIDLENAYLPEFHAPDRSLENVELQQIIRSAVDRLPDKCRMIYLMAWEEQLSHKEIASKLGVSAKTVENHVGIALRKLREYLRPYYDSIL